MYLDNVYFVGFTTKVSRPEVLPEPMAPSNYRDPVKIREKVEEIKDRLRPQMLTCPGIATITSIDIYNWKAKSVFKVDTLVDSPFEQPAVKFWNWLDGFRHGCYGYTLCLTPEEFVSPDAVLLGPAFFGFRIKSFMQIAAIEAAANNIWSNLDGKPRIKIPVQIWRDHLGVCDPYEAMFTEEQRKLVSLGAAINLLLGDVVDEESLYQKPRTQAMLAHRMTLRGQLLGTDPESYIGYSGEHGWSCGKGQEDTEIGSPREAGAASGG